MGNEKQTITRLLIASDHQVIREGLHLMLSKNTEIQLVGFATSIPETIRLVGELQPNVLLIDPYTYNQDGLKAIKLIRGEWPQIAVIVFTIHPSEGSMLHALRAGASVYLTIRTNHAELFHAIRTAARGETLLQPEYVAHLLARVEAPEPNKNDPQIKGREELELTEREHEVLQRVAYGERNKEIAARLGISEPTVKSHLANSYFKLGVDSRASAVAVAIERGILSLQKK